jgi:hypothetical protein
MTINDYKTRVSEIINYYKDIIDRKVKLSLDEEADVKLSLYKLENKLVKTKEYFDLPVLDSSLFLKDKTDIKFFEPKGRGYFRPKDYEYYFLIYSLLNHDIIANQELVRIIQDFFTYEKVNFRLKLEDIERTQTGSVRCKTNLRFTIFHLREMGFINSFEKGKRAWSLTIPGFLVAAFICLNNPFSKFGPYDYNLTALPDDDEIYFFKNIDRKLYNVIEWLSNKEIINDLFNWIDEPMQADNANDFHIFPDKFKNSDKLANECHSLFCHYKDFLDSYIERRNYTFNKKEFYTHLDNFIKNTNEVKELQLFKTRFSDLINTKRLLAEVKRIMEEKR